MQKALLLPSVLAPDIVGVVRIAVLVDVIAIASGITIILPATDNRPDDTAEYRASNGAGSSTNARKDRAGKCSCARANGCACCGTGDLVVVG